MWYVVENIRESDSRVLSADVRVPADSPWFSGHFPGEPILPGVAQVGMVLDAISRAGKGNTKIRSISRVKFRQVIRPDDHLRVIVFPKGEESGTYSFRIMLEEEVVCSGALTLGE